MAGIQIDGVNNKIDFDDDADTSISSSTDDTLVFEVGGTNLHSMSATLVDINTSTSITVADNAAALTLKSTDADAAVGPVLSLHRESSSPADDDIIGRINFIGEDSGGTDTTYGRIETVIMQESNGSEDATMEFRIIKGGTEINLLELDRGEVCINQDSASVDFRVESNGNDKALIVKGANDRVGIGGENASFGILGVENAGDATVDLFSNVGSGTEGKAEIFFSTDTSSDHLSCASIVMQQDGASSRKGEILFKVSDNGGPTTALTIANNGVVSGNLNDTSDENLKKNIEDLEASTNIIKQLKPRKFDWKQTSAGSNIAGFVAQEVETVIPDAVVGNDYVATTFYEDGDTIPNGHIIGDVKELGNKGKALNTTAILAHAVKTIQELEARIAALEGN